MEQILEEHWLYVDFGDGDIYKPANRTCLIVSCDPNMTEGDGFFCGFYPIDTPVERIHDAMKIIVGENIFKIMDLRAIPHTYKANAWPVIRDFMADKDYSTAEKIAELQE